MPDSPAWQAKSCVPGTHRPAVARKNSCGCPSHPFFLHNSEQKEPRSTGLIRPA